MNTTLTPESVRCWASTGLAGSLAATAVVFLFAASATAPAHARPAQQPRCTVAQRTASQPSD